MILSHAFLLDRIQDYEMFFWFFLVDESSHDTVFHESEISRTVDTDSSFDFEKERSHEKKFVSIPLG